MRREAKDLIGASVERHAQRCGRKQPCWALSFSARGGWGGQHADGSLRFNWRLIEQSAAVIEQVVSQAVASLPDEKSDATADFWDMQPA